MALVARTPRTRTIDVPEMSPGGVASGIHLRWRRWMAVSIAAAVVAAVLATALARLAAPPPPQVIVASGRIEGRTVTLAPKNIQGRVKSLLVDEGDPVRKGQTLAELEADHILARHGSLSAQVASLDAQIAEARLDVTYTAKNSQATIDAAEAAVSAALAAVVRAQAVLVNARSEHRRAADLYDAGAMSRQELDQRETAARIGAADLESAEKNLARAEANLALARASADTVVLKRQRVRALEQTRRAAAGQVQEADANLAERYILAPSDGTILSRTAEVGSVVNAGSPVFEMVDLNRLYVKVYIAEADVGKLRLGDEADIAVDAFPHTRFSARVSKVHDEAEFTPKNVETAEERLKLVFGVELALVNPEGLLKPGMPADCVIHWKPPGGVRMHP